MTFIEREMRSSQEFDQQIYAAFLSGGHVWHGRAALALIWFTRIAAWLALPLAVVSA